MREWGNNGRAGETKLDYFFDASREEGARRRDGMPLAVEGGAADEAEGVEGAVD